MRHIRLSPFEWRKRVAQDAKIKFNGREVAARCRVINALSIELRDKKSLHAVEFELRIVVGEISQFEGLEQAVGYCQLRELPSRHEPYEPSGEIFIEGTLILNSERFLDIWHSIGAEHSHSLIDLSINYRGEWAVEEVLNITSASITFVRPVNAKS